MIYEKLKLHRYWIKKFTKPTAYYTHQGALQLISNMTCSAPFLLNEENRPLIEFYTFTVFTIE